MNRGREEVEFARMLHNEEKESNIKYSSRKKSGPYISYMPTNRSSRQGGSPSLRIGEDYKDYKAGVRQWGAKQKRSVRGKPMKYVQRGNEVVGYERKHPSKVRYGGAEKGRGQETVPADREN